MRKILVFLLVLAIVTPVFAVENNPSVDSQPWQCKYTFSKWLCTPQGAGIQGPQGPPGPMNQTPNMTAGPVGSGGIADFAGVFFTNGTREMTGIFNAGGFRASNASDPVASKDLVTLSYFNAHISDDGGTFNASYETIANDSVWDNKYNQTVFDNFANYQSISNDSVTDNAMNTSMKTYVDNKVITDHHFLTNLTVDDHPMYFRSDGSRAYTGGYIVGASDDSYMGMIAGPVTPGSGGLVLLGGRNWPTLPGGVAIYTPNAAKSVWVLAMQISGNTDTPTPVFAGFTKGASSVSNGGTIAHGCGTTPTACVLTGTNISQTYAVTAKGTTTITVGIGSAKTGNTGVTDTVNWMCWL